MSVCSSNSKSCKYYVMAIKSSSAQDSSRYLAKWKWLLVVRKTFQQPARSVLTNVNYRKIKINLDWRI